MNALEKLFETLPEAQRSIYASRVIHLLTQSPVEPRAEVAAHDRPFVEAAQQLLRDASPKQKAAVWTYLSKQAQRPSLAPDAGRAENTEARLLARGLVKPSSIPLVATDLLKEFAAHQLRKSDVVTALREPERVQVLDDYAVLVTHQAVDGSTLLVGTSFEKRTLRFEFAYRMFPDAVDLRQAETPLDYLRALTTAYGIEFALNGRRHMLVVEDSVPAFNDQLQLKPASDRKTAFRAHAAIRRTPLATMRVTYAFVVDTTKYEADRRSRARR